MDRTKSANTNAIWSSLEQMEVSRIKIDLHEVKSNALEYDSFEFFLGTPFHAVISQSFLCFANSGVSSRRKKRRVGT